MIAELLYDHRGCFLDAGIQGHGARFALLKALLQIHLGALTEPLGQFGAPCITRKPLDEVLVEYAPKGAQE